MRRALLAALLGLALAACTTAAAPPSAEPQAYSGEWEWHFETSSFTTYDGQGPWWLSAEGAAWDDMIAPIQRSGGGPWGRVAVTVEATLSAPGRYGHLGAYEREIRVLRVMDARLIAASEPPSGS